LPAAASGGGILDLMLQKGVYRTTGAAFLWAFVEERKHRRNACGALAHQKVVGLTDRQARPENPPGGRRGR